MPDVAYAPIIVSVYDRLDHLTRCVEALLANDLASESLLYIVSDAPYKEEHGPAIQKVREYASSIIGFKEVHLLFREKNLGAHESIKTAIAEVLQTYTRFLFLEDDIVVSNDFLRYMNEGLNYYEKEEKVFAICGFSLPFHFPSNYDKDVYFYPCNSPWGFASWRDRWLKVDLDYCDRYALLKQNPKKYKAFASIGFYIKGILQADSSKKIQAMDLRVYYHMFSYNMCSVFPVSSKTQNWGFDGSGEHCGSQRAWWAKPTINTSSSPITFIPFEGYNPEILKNHRIFQEKINGGILAKYLKYTWVHRLYNKLKTKLV